MNQSLKEIVDSIALPEATWVVWKALLRENGVNIVEDNSGCLPSDNVEKLDVPGKLSKCTFPA